MLPANQRLKPNDAPRGQLDLRLVIQHKLLLLQRLPQVRLARPDSSHRLYRALMPQAVSIERLAQSAQLQLAGGDIGKALQHAQLGHRHGPARLAGKDRQRAQNFAIYSAYRSAGKRKWIEPAQRKPSLPELGIIVDVRDHHRAVLGQHSLKDRLLPRQLPHRLAPVRLRPHPALVGKPQQDCVGFEILGGQARDGVKVRLRRGVKNPRRGQSFEPRILFLPSDLPIANSACGITFSRSREIPTGSPME